VAPTGPQSIDEELLNFDSTKLLRPELPETAAGTAEAQSAKQLATKGAKEVGSGVSNTLKGLQFFGLPINLSLGMIFCYPNLGGIEGKKLLWFSLGL
jgi:hypothetical protein